MKVLGKNKGITLISLVVTIVVLLILAGISINALIGNNGLLNKTIGAKEEYSKAEVKEKVSLLLSEYTIDNATEENKDFAKFLRKNLQVGVAKNEDNTYSFLLDKWQVITTENKIVSIEKFKLDVDKIYPNVANMKSDAELTAGKLVKTEGYWDKTYGGSAYYDIVSTTNLIVDEGKCIRLNNGLYAELHAINDTVTVNQFGAYGDGEHDDATVLQSALNSGYENILLEENNEYKICDVLTFAKDIILIGKNSTIFTDNDFSGSREWLIMISNNNTSMFGINIEARETIADVGYTSQLYIGNCSNANVYNCSFTIPETASPNHGYVNIDCYASWHNVIIDSCNLTLVNDAESGGCIWIRDFYKNGSSSLTFKNNTCYKISHDEILAVFSGSIENVDIINNSFTVEEKNASASAMNFTFGSDTSTLCNNIKFENNEINAKGSEVIKAKSLTNNLSINNNNINFTVTRDDISSYIIRSEASNSNFSNNNINLYVEDEDYLVEHGIYGFSRVTGNTLNIYSNIIDVIENCTNFENNIINIDKNCDIIFNGCINIKNNKVYSNGNINKVFQWYNNGLDVDVHIDNNHIELSKNTGDLFMINRCTMNNYKVIATNNTIDCNSNITVGRLLFIFVTDENPQTIVLKCNNFGLYRATNRYVVPSNQNIIIED